MASNCDRRKAREALAEQQSSSGGDSDSGGEFRPYGNPKLDPQKMTADHKRKLAAAAKGKKRSLSDKRAISKGMAKCESGGSANEATNILREKLARLDLEIGALRARIREATGSGKIVWEGQLERALAKRGPMVAAIAELEQEWRDRNKGRK